MKRSYQRILLTAAILILCMLTQTTNLRKSTRKEAISRTVTKNLDLLLEDIDANNFTNSKKLRRINDIHVTPHTVEYSCGGSGLGSATSYYGFYYSSTDDMSAIWCAGTPLKEYGDGYLYEEKNGDNRYYTEHIIDHFYYYEASF